MSFARLGPISVNNLLKDSAILFRFLNFLISYTNVFGEMLLLNFFFPKSFFNHGPCFPYITLYLNIKVEYFLNILLFFQTFAYSFCIHLHFFHFLFLETSHTVVAYVSKISLSQLLSTDFEYLCF